MLGTRCVTTSLNNNEKDQRHDEPTPFPGKPSRLEHFWTYNHEPAYLHGGAKYQSSFFLNHGGNVIGMVADA